METLYKLADQSGVPLEKLAESADLYALVKEGTPFDKLLAWVKKNF